MLAQISINLGEVAFLLAFPIAAALGVFAGIKGRSGAGFLIAGVIGVVVLLTGGWLYLDPRDTGFPQLTLLLDTFGICFGLCYLFRRSLHWIGLAVLATSILGIVLVGYHL